MPFTPFHMGPALVTKAVLGRHFSVPLYGFMQLAIDSEVLAGYAFRRDLAYHKILHTFAGATSVAAVTVFFASGVSAGNEMVERVDQSRSKSGSGRARRRV